MEHTISETDKIFTAPAPPRDAIVVLGAAVWPDGPSPALRRRVGHALALYRVGAAPVILCCGGLGRFPPTEAEAMRALLRDSGVPEAAILCEDRSRTTLENLVFARALAAPRGLRRIVVVTDRYHLPRSLRVARWAGFDAVGSSPAAPRYPLWRARVRPVLREWGARPLYAARLLIRRPPR